MPERKTKETTDNIDAPLSADGGGNVSRESFEELLARVERAAERLESGEIGLDEALRRYAEGVGELRKAAAVLREAEARVKVLVESDEGLRLDDLDGDDGEDGGEDDDPEA